MKHHTLLHNPSSNPQPLNVSSSHFSLNFEAFPLFRIQPVVLFANGLSLTVFAFIDEGSSLTLLEADLAKQLGVSGPKEPLTLLWTGNVSREESKSQRIDIEIAGSCSRSPTHTIQTHTVKSLVLPTQTLRYRDLSDRFPHLRGLPIEEYEKAQPKLLIGIDNLRLTVPLKVREGAPTDPIAAKCRLGWGIYGSAPRCPQTVVPINLHVSATSDPDRELNEQLRDYFAVESVGTLHPTTNTVESEENKRALKIMEQTTRRTSSGFETGLLWRTDCVDFPESYAMAARRLQSLERKLAHDNSLHDSVRQLIWEYERKGYAHKATMQELDTMDRKHMWFLPLGVVRNPKKPAKIRLIWDAAAKSHGVSFNSKLLKGPDLLTPLVAVLSRFRQYPVAVCGDIREMFHQIAILPQDRSAQCFLWRDGPTEPIQTYIMDVATFGSTCSPTSAQYIKNRNAQDFANDFPRAAVAIVENHYVDDYLDSFRTIQEAVEVANEVKLVHSRGGFELRNFSSNSEQVLQGIGETSDSVAKDLVLVRGDVESVLGMKWLPKDDTFTYTFTMREDLRPVLANGHIPTKREVLKVVMSLFDPLGLISFYLVHGKILIQEIWASGCSWDETIGNDLYVRWRQWTNMFPGVRVRCVLPIACRDRISNCSGKRQNESCTLKNTVNSSTRTEGRGSRSTSFGDCPKLP